MFGSRKNTTPVNCRKRKRFTFTFTEAASAAAEPPAHRRPKLPLVNVNVNVNGCCCYLTFTVPFNGRLSDDPPTSTVNSPGATAQSFFFTS